MQFIKKTISILLIIGLTLSFASCGSSQGDVKNTESAKSTQSPVSTTGIPTAESTDAPTAESTETPASTAASSSATPDKTETATPSTTPVATATQTEPVATATKNPTAAKTTAAKATATKAPVTKATATKTTETKATATKATATKTTETKATATKATATKTPTKTAAPTNKPANTYSPVSGVTISNDSVQPAVNLDTKVPNHIKETYQFLKNELSTNKISGSGEQTIAFPKGISLEVLQDAIYYMENYNPQFFYIDWTQISYSMQNDQVISVTLVSTANVSQYAAVEKKVNQIVAEANQKPNLFERELYVHDWLVKNVVYNKTTNNCATIYGALIEGKAKCEGYARAFQYLMNKIGVETVLISGDVGEAHMWNMVKLYGQYYFVDVTHDDPTPDVAIPKGKEHLISHSCFNVTSATLGKTHTIYQKGGRVENGFLLNPDLQTCTATKYGYYQVKGLAVSNLSQFQYAVKENSVQQSVEVFFAGTMPSIKQLQEALEAVLSDMYPDNGYSYTYTTPDSAAYKRNTIRISWTIE